MIHTKMALVCDTPGCENEKVFKRSMVDQTDARYTAKRSGWLRKKDTMGKMRDLCPACHEKQWREKRRNERRTRNAKV